MNLFTVNQVNHVYVTTGLKTSGHLTKTNEDKGKIYMGITAPSDKHIQSFIKESIYFEHSGPGGITRSDNIDIDKIMYVHATPASEMKTELMQYVLTVDNSATVSGAGTYVLPNTDYILRIELTNYIGVSPEDSHYWKYGMVHTVANMTVADFYKTLAKSIIKNMSREAVKFLDIYDGSTKIETISDAESATFSNGIILREVEPDWILGLKKQKIVHFNVTGVPFEYDGEVIYWLNGEGEETDVTAVASGVILNNSKLAADYEYFFHGERGDQYRMIGWPDYIPTKYMVDSENQNGYDFIQLHYSYIGPNEGAQKSEKDITFLVPAGSGNTLSDASQSIVNAIQTVIDAKATTVANNAIDAAVKAGTIASGQ